MKRLGNGEGSVTLSDASMRANITLIWEAIQRIEGMLVAANIERDRALKVKEIDRKVKDRYKGVF